MHIIDKLTQLREQKAQLEEAELSLMQQIIETVGHKSLGQKTYDLDGRKVVVKTAENYTLDKAKLNVVWKETMPINRSYAYTLRQKDYDAIMTSGSPAQRKVMSEIVTTKPAKPTVKVES